jgi:hypothetical protein
MHLDDTYLLRFIEPTSEQLSPAWSISDHQDPPSVKIITTPTTCHILIIIDSTGSNVRSLNAWNVTWGGQILPGLHLRVSDARTIVAEYGRKPAGSSFFFSFGFRPAGYHQRPTMHIGVYLFNGGLIIGTGYTQGTWLQNQTLRRDIEL